MATNDGVSEQGNVVSLFAAKGSKISEVQNNSMLALRERVKILKELGNSGVDVRAQLDYSAISQGGMLP